MNPLQHTVSPLPYETCPLQEDLWFDPSILASSQTRACSLRWNPSTDEIMSKYLFVVFHGHFRVVLLNDSNDAQRIILEQIILTFSLFVE